MNTKSRIGRPQLPFPRVILAVITPIVLLSSAIAPLLIWRDRLPPRLATHWPLTGPADGATSFNALLIAVSGITLISAVVSIVTGLHRWTSEPSQAAALGTFISILITCLVGITIKQSLDRTDWHGTPGPALWQLGIAFVLATLLASVVASAIVSLSGPNRGSESSPAAPPTLDLANQERVMWSNRITNRWLLLPTAAMLLLSVVSFIRPHATNSRWEPVVFALVALATSLLASVSVRADEKGLHLRYGPFNWPKQTIPLDRIRTASAIDLKPSEWGGWGYRGSLKILKRAAVVLRGGPALRVDLHNGAKFAVSIGDSETGAAVLNTAIARIGTSAASVP
jgi:hypothetical protein